MVATIPASVPSSPRTAPREILRFSRSTPGQGGPQGRKAASNDRTGQACPIRYRRDRGCRARPERILGTMRRIAALFAALLLPACGGPPFTTADRAATPPSDEAGNPGSQVPIPDPVGDAASAGNRDDAGLPDPPPPPPPPPP